MKYKKINLLILFAILITSLRANAQERLSFSDTIISETVKTGNEFSLVNNGKSSVLWYDAGDYKGVIRAVADLQKDIEKVTNCKPEITISNSGKKKSGYYWKYR